MRIDNSALSWLAVRADQTKLRLPGTDRARPPEATLAMATDAAAKVGVTRVADITRLDTIGIPTFQAIRPAAATVAVSQGKGITPELAKVSAMMEAIEIWHVEQPLVPVATAAPREVAGQLCYPVAELAPSVPSLLHDGLPLDWVPARSLLDGSRTLVPVEVVRLSLERKQGWHPPAFLASTNGLASGNTLIEAVLHALYEVIERDATTTAVTTGHRGVPVAPATLGSPIVDELCRLIAAADVELSVGFLASRAGLPCFLASVRGEDYPAEMFGFGCHVDPEIALTRAITEAVQTRLGYVSGARDDLDDDIEPPRGARRPDSGTPGDIRPLLPPPVAPENLLDDLDHVLARTTAGFGHVPLVVDLTREDIGVPVVKVVAPGSRICPEVL